jgi:hypothetical protein
LYVEGSWREIGACVFRERRSMAAQQQQTGKPLPQLDQNSTKELNLTVLQRMDRHVEDILTTAAHVTFYQFSVEDSQWVTRILPHKHPLLLLLLLLLRLLLLLLISVGVVLCFCWFLFCMVGFFPFFVMSFVLC